MNEVQKTYGPWLKDLIIEAVSEAIRETLPLILEEQFSNESDPLKRFYSREEVCRKLSICKATYHNWIKAGKLKVVKIQGRSYIDAVCLDKALESGQFRKVGKK